MQPPLKPGMAQLVLAGKRIVCKQKKLQSIIAQQQINPAEVSFLDLESINRVIASQFDVNGLVFDTMLQFETTTNPPGPHRQLQELVESLYPPYPQ